MDPSNTSNPGSCQPCPIRQCDNPFDRVVVSYLTRGGTRLMWELRRDFLDARPYTFQLQVGQSAAPDADDWVDVGSPVVDIFAAVDGEQRLFGKIRWQFYRVILTTSAGTYYSAPVGLEGTLGRADWRIARAILRQELIRMRVQGGGQIGYLLKRRVSGTPCPVCLDQLTNEILDPNCQTCFGTGFLCGYFFPIACVWAELDPKTYRAANSGDRGTVADIVVKARMANPWMLSEEDVWVNKITDDRYYVHTVQNIAERRGVPLVSSVEMRPAPFTSPIYDIVVPSQLESLGQMRETI